MSSMAIAMFRHERRPTLPKGSRVESEGEATTRRHSSEMERKEGTSI